MGNPPFGESIVNTFNFWVPLQQIQVIALTKTIPGTIPQSPFLYIGGMEISFPVMCGKHDIV